jgi:hypothetical protein
MNEPDSNATSGCIILPSYEDGTYRELFWEYISGVVLREQGYFVTHCSTGGGGDIFTYFLPDYLEQMQRNPRLIGRKGVFLEELEMLPVIEEKEGKTNSQWRFPKSERKTPELVCIEAESSDTKTISTIGKNVGVGNSRCLRTRTFGAGTPTQQGGVKSPQTCI